MKREINIRIVATSDDVAVSKETEAAGHAQPTLIRATLYYGALPEPGEIEICGFSGLVSEGRDLGSELEGFLDAVRAEVKEVLAYLAEETPESSTTVVE
jgi:hypothetical protein